MNDRKQHVIHKAHQLFIEKGFQATSIQDIIDFSGISKGTFYNYFPSKNELLMAIFKSLNQRIDKERNELLIGQDPADIEIFIQQIEMQMNFNQRNKLLTLFEEVIVSNDPTLKEFLKGGQIMHLRWLYNRFVDLFDKTKQPYLLDCAIMFHGILHHNIHFHILANESNHNIKQVIRYTVDRLIALVDDVEKNSAQLLSPAILDEWLPHCNNARQVLKKKIENGILTIKRCVSGDNSQLELSELLDFIQGEVIHSKTPRKYLIQSALSTLRAHYSDTWETELHNLDTLLEMCLN